MRVYDFIPVAWWSMVQVRKSITLKLTILVAVLMIVTAGALNVAGFFLGPKHLAAALAIEACAVLAGSVVAYLVIAHVTQPVDELSVAEEKARDQTTILQSIIDNMSDGVVVADENGKFLIFNPAASAITMIGRTDTVPDEWTERYGLYLPDTVTPFPTHNLPMVRAIRGECVDSVEIFMRHAQAPGGIWLSVNARPLRNASGTVKGGVAVFQDITQRKRIERFMTAQHSVTRALAESSSLRDAAPRILREICDSLNWEVGALWTLMPGGNVLRCMEFWHVEDRNVSDFEGMTRQVTLSSGIGLPGRVLATGEPAWIPDVTQDRNFPRAHMAAKSGLHGAFGFPIRLRDTVLGIIEFFSHEIREPDQGLLDMMAAVGGQIGLFIERRQSEDALRLSETKFRRVIETANDAFISMDSRGIIADWNRQAESTFGWSRDEAIGKTLADLIIPDRFRDAHRQGLSDFLKTGQGPVLNKRIEISALHRDGHEFSIELTVSAAQVVEEWIFHAFIRDITERQRSERALKDSEALYQSLVESLPLNVFRKDREGRFTFSNQLFCQTTGRPLQEILGKTDRDFYDPELAEKYQKDDRDVMESGVMFQDVEEHRTPNGKKLFVQVWKTPLYDSSRKITGTQCLFWDVTDQKRAEEELRQTAEELARSNEELQQFAYVASHDLQEPLRMVASYLQLLERRYKGKLDANADEFIGFAVDGATRMQQLIGDLLAYSRVGTRGKEFQPTDCSDIVQKALTNLMIAIEESGAKITVGQMPKVFGDSVQLTQLFQNVIGNAIKFHGDSPPEVRIDASAENGQWKFSVQDNGIGIDPQYADRIFLIFQRLHSRREYSGTGIGLAICKKIVERHGGRIWLESAVGPGSKFLFTLPAIKKQQG